MRGMTTMAGLLVGLLSVALAACAEDRPRIAIPTPTVAAQGTVAASATPVAASLSKEGCEVRGSQPGGPVADRQGPYYHQVVVARTSDGLTLTSARQVLDHASVPDGVRMADGSVRIYYVNGEDGGVWVARMDGDAATPIGPISIDGVSRPQGVVDPDATAMPDGKIRLAYLGSFGPPSSTSTWSMCLAESSDGVNFRLLGRAVVFTDAQTTDPSIARLDDGTWLMAVSQGQATVMARSSDGLTFAPYAKLTFGGVPELSTVGDGRVRLYVCARGIESYVSADRGTTWQREGTVTNLTPAKKIVCDPSRVAGTNLFIYKSAD